MNDIRKAAQERASRTHSNPAGTSLETERQRMKNALARQISSQDGSNVRMIAATPETPEG